MRVKTILASTVAHLDSIDMTCKIWQYIYLFPQIIVVSYKQACKWQEPRKIDLH